LLSTLLQGDVGSIAALSHIFFTPQLRHLFLPSGFVRFFAAVLGAMQEHSRRGLAGMTTAAGLDGTAQ